MDGTPRVALLRDREDALRYVAGGRGGFTLTSVRTGRRYSYRMWRMRDGSVHVSVRLERVWREVCRLDTAGHYRIARGALPREHEAARGFQWFWQVALQSDAAFRQVTVTHDGRCGVCGRRLDTPESVARGLGPVCAGRPLKK